MQVSNLKFYSKGVAAENKPLSSRELKITPLEPLSMTSGEMTTNTTELSAKGASAERNTDTKVQAAGFITATWKSFGSNRITPPDIRTGEEVMVLQFENLPTYYWMPWDDGIKYRKLETVIFAISNTRNEDEQANFETAYFIEFSTHAKHLHLHTSKNDGEPFELDLQINAKEGFFLYQDDSGLMISADSAEDRIEIKNHADSHVDLNKKDLTITVKGNVTVKCDKATVDASKATVNANTDINGNTKISGNLVVGGSTTTSGISSVGGAPASFSGTISGSGAMSIDGPINSPSSITAPNLRYR